MAIRVRTASQPQQFLQRFWYEAWSHTRYGPESIAVILFFQYGYLSRTLFMLDYEIKSVATKFFNEHGHDFYQVHINMFPSPSDKRLYRLAGYVEK